MKFQFRQVQKSAKSISQVCTGYKYPFDPLSRRAGAITSCAPNFSAAARCTFGVRQSPVMLPIFALLLVFTHDPQQSQVAELEMMSPAVTLPESMTREKDSKVSLQNLT